MLPGGRRTSPAISADFRHELLAHLVAHHRMPRVVRFKHPLHAGQLCGMHHMSRRHGFNSFFLTPHGLPANRFDHFKPHQLFCHSFTVHRTRPSGGTFPAPRPTSSAPEATAEAYAPEPSSDPAPPHADARAGRSAPCASTTCTQCGLAPP